MIKAFSQVNMFFFFNYRFQEEKIYIESSVADSKSTSELPFPPVVQILTSQPFIALTLAHFGQLYGLHVLMIEIPTYLNNIQHFPLKNVCWPIFL